MSSHGLTIPFGQVTLAGQAALVTAAAEAGFTDLWSGEVNGRDAFAPLVAAAITDPRLRLGTAIVSAFTRGPAILAMSAASICELSQAQVSIGIGASSDVVVEQWNGVPFTRPMRRVEDVASFLRRAFTGEKVTMHCDSFDISGFRLGVALARPPKVLIAALRPGMLRLAGRVADGAILNWLSPEDVAKVVPLVAEGNDDPEIVARLFVVLDPDRARARRVAKRMIAAYLNVGVYQAQQRFLGRGEQLQAMWELWAAGERERAVAAVPDAVVDDLFVLGAAHECRTRVAEYVAAGVTTPVLHLVGGDLGDPADAIRSLGPAT